ncbi:dihydroxy-acid dehydratase domain-containing protein [Pandoraea anhela]|uniref:dihydroxy-acid dehydratase domain-containing protein n=1 Tax=Pandoraea anhela TaxID=2508295 RepID=UPI00123EF205|nr:dihydroxy-acid dehydratase [Pandoraea anhela]
MLAASANPDPPQTRRVGIDIGRRGRTEAAAGGPIRRLRDGDTLHIDAIKGKLDVELSDRALAARAV